MGKIDKRFWTKPAEETSDLARGDLNVGDRVKVICKGQDSYFFRGETGKVIRKKDYKYLDIIVEFDEPRHFVDGYIQTEFNFDANDLILLEREPLIAIPEEDLVGDEWEVFM